MASVDGWDADDTWDPEAGTTAATDPTGYATAPTPAAASEPRDKPNEAPAANVGVALGCGPGGDGDAWDAVAGEPAPYPRGDTTAATADESGVATEGSSTAAGLPAAEAAEAPAEPAMGSANWWELAAVGPASDDAPADNGDAAARPAEPTTGGSSADGWEAANSWSPSAAAAPTAAPPADLASDARHDVAQALLTMAEHPAPPPGAADVHGVEAPAPPATPPKSPVSPVRAPSAGSPAHSVLFTPPRSLDRVLRFFYRADKLAEAITGTPLAPAEPQTPAAAVAGVPATPASTVYAKRMLATPAPAPSNVDVDLTPYLCSELNEVRRGALAGGGWTCVHCRSPRYAPLTGRGALAGGVHQAGKVSCTRLPHLKQALETQHGLYFPPESAPAFDFFSQQDEVRQGRCMAGRARRARRSLGQTGAAPGAVHARRQELDAEQVLELLQATWFNNYDALQDDPKLDTIRKQHTSFRMAEAANLDDPSFADLNGAYGANRSLISNQEPSVDVDGYFSSSIAGTHLRPSRLDFNGATEVRSADAQQH